MPPSAFKDYTVTYHSGERIFSEGEKGIEFYVVQSGRVEIFKQVEGERKPLSHMEKGDFFGELSVLLDVPRADSAEALEKSELIVINSTVFDQMIRTNIEIAVRILRKLSLRLLEASEKLQALGGASASQAIRSPSVTLPETAAQPAAAAPSRGDGQEPIEGTYLETEDSKLRFPLQGAALTIGRFDPVTGLKPEVDLSAVDINRSVSRRHAKLQISNGVYQISEEVGSLNGTLLNNRRLVPGKPTPLKDGDTIHFGMVRLRFRQHT
ncbi:MAG: cyclic nucleotide-binding domain-containing protein [Acidobacteriota bacterium]